MTAQTRNTRPDTNDLGVNDYEQNIFGISMAKWHTLWEVMQVSCIRWFQAHLYWRSVDDGTGTREPIRSWEVILFEV